MPKVYCSTFHLLLTVSDLCCTRDWRLIAIACIYCFTPAIRGREPHHTEAANSVFTLSNINYDVGVTPPTSFETRGIIFPIPPCALVAP